MNLPPPINQKMEVLHELLINDSVCRRELLLSTGILNPTARLSELRNDHLLPIKTATITVKNKFGRNAYFGQWSLENKQTGIELYKKLNA